MAAGRSGRHDSRVAGRCWRGGEGGASALAATPLSPRAAVLGLLVFVASAASVATARQPPVIGREVAIEHHLRDGEELTLSTAALIEFGRRLFAAAWTDQDG